LAKVADLTLMELRKGSWMFWPLRLLSYWLVKTLTWACSGARQSRIMLTMMAARLAAVLRENTELIPEVSFFIPPVAASCSHAAARNRQ